MTGRDAAARRRAGWIGANRALVVSGGLLVLIVVIVLVLPLLLPDPNVPSPLQRLSGPSAVHLLGTDNYGRDVLSRLVSGGRATLGLTLVVTIATTLLGTLVGLVSGFFRPVDGVLMRIMDAGMAFPGIVLAMALAIAMGASALSEFIALTVIFTPATARVVRSRVLGLSAQQFVTAARASGMRAWKILLVHVVPHTFPLMLVQLVIIAALAMLTDSALSYLGLGIAPPTPTWGNMIADGRAYMSVAPLLIIAPGLAIVICVALLNVVGDALRPFADPEARTLTRLDRIRARMRRLASYGGSARDRPRPAEAAQGTRGLTS